MSLLRSETVQGLGSIPQKWWIAILLLAYVGLATWYSLTIPLGEAPDEVPHFTYVRYLARNHSLPTTTEEHEAFQPPLYYILGAALTANIKDNPNAPFSVRANADFDVEDPRAPKNLLLHTANEDWPFKGWVLAWHWLRILSIALGTIAVWAAYSLGRVLFPDQVAIPLAMAALMAFTPQFLFVSSVANNDNAAIAFSALALWQTGSLLHNASGQRVPAQFWRRCLALGLVLGLGLLSKASLVGLIPVVGLSIIVAAFLPCRLPTRSNAPPVSVKRLPLGRAIARALAGLALAFGVAALVAGWYFVRNWVLHSDPMGWSFLEQINATRQGPLTVEVLTWLARGVFRSFWLGWIGIEFDEVIYWALGIISLIGLTGFVLWLVRSWRELGAGAKWSLILLGTHVAITIGSLVQWTALVLGTDQGRLIFPILPTVMLTLTVGWAWWSRGRAQSWVLGLLTTGMLVLAVMTPLHYIGPVYAPAPKATLDELNSAVPLNVDWGNVRLLGYRLEKNRLIPGDKLVLNLYWQARDPIDQDLVALIQLVDQDGRFLMYTDGSPSAGRDTTDRWAPGIPLASQHLLRTPGYGQPGEYRLTISIHPFGNQDWLTATRADGTVLGDHLVLPEVIDLALP